MTSPEDIDRQLLLDDLAYHQVRVLLLVTAVSDTSGHGRKLDGLTKLAKLDFLLRYPAAALAVLDNLSPYEGPGVRTDELDQPDVEAPMIRYKFGPWDDRYYAIIGALIGRGLVRYAAARKGNVAIAPTAAGRKLVLSLQETDDWTETYHRSRAIAEASTGMTGNALKELIYSRLGELMNRPHRQVIR